MATKKRKKKKFVKRFILIGFLLLVNAAAIWFMYFRDQVHIKTAQPLATGQQMVQGNAVELKDLPAEKKRIMINNGALNIPPPCPKFTHEENNFCRKGSFKGDTKTVFVGNQNFELDAQCGPDNCVEQCKALCEEAVGEDCWLQQFVYQECLTDYPAFGPLGRDGPSSCMQEHSKEYENYRCRFLLSKQDEPSYPNEAPTKPVTFESCKKDYDDFQTCTQKLKVDQNNKDSIISYYESLELCQKRYDKQFVSSSCGTFYNKADRRFTDAADKIFCHVSCL